MKIKKKSYMGIIGFYMRKKFPIFCSNSYLFLQRKISDGTNKKFMKIEKECIIPLFVNIETINMCNGLCPFCCCNIKTDVRKKTIMKDDVFKKIINELSFIDYSSVITLNINNEPFLDDKLIEKLEYIREKIPKSYSFLYTNGSVLTIDKLDKIINYNLLDELIINNYNDSYKMNSNIKKIYNYLKGKNIRCKITINMRYAKEVLSNRANTSPNKVGKKIIKNYCSIPFTDINIFPDGKIGLCCCDAKEITNFGNIMEDNIIKIFNNEKFKQLREKMLSGRSNNEFCKYCDFNDIGTRRKRIKKALKINKRV